MQVCQFYVGNILYGVDVTDIIEIIRFQNETPVPLAANCIRGLINLRGQIITAVDLRARLGLTPQAASEHSMCLIVNDIEGPPVSLVVDRIGDVIDIQQEELEDTPETVPKNYRILVDGIIKLEKELLLMLNLRKTLHFH